MAKVCKLYVGIVTALALCKYSLAEWNVTDESANRTVSHCHPHGNGDNCTDLWNSHFSKCPEELTHYCVHGECRYIEEQKAPSCRCHDGYIGARCEYLIIDPHTQDKREIIIIGVIAGLVCLILLMIFICICSHRRCRFCWGRRRRREAPSNVTEKLSMMDTGATQTPLPADSSEPPHDNTV